MAKVVFDNNDIVVVHMDEYTEMEDVFMIGNGSIELKVEGIKRACPIYNTMMVVPVSIEGYDDSYIIFSDTQVNMEQNPELWEKLDNYWQQYKQDNREDFYDEEGNEY